MKNLVEYIIKNLVVNVDTVKVSVDETDDNNTTIYVEVDKTDMGKVIGKNGKIANALRAIVKTASSNTKTKYFVKFIEK